MEAIVIIILLFVIIFIILKFKNNHTKPNQIRLENCSISHDVKYSGIYIKISIDDFNSKGFCYGDSVNIYFSNGYKLLDIPYYNGYYVDFNNTLLVGYPGYEYIKISVNYGEDMWYKAKLSEKNTANVILNEKGKYLKNQTLRDIHYIDIQGNTKDDIFANYRMVNVGNIKDDILFRGASPIDNTHNRASIVDKLLKKDNIKNIIDLADDDELIRGFIKKEDFDSPYFLSLYKSKKVLPLAMNMLFKTEFFNAKLVKGLTIMASNDGPYYIHCVEGKDRTGYFLMIVEGLLGASYQEIINDYMLSYQNYYSITKEKDNERYSLIKDKNIDLMLNYVVNNQNIDITKIDDYSSYVKNYLLRIGMNEITINNLINKLSK